MPIFEPSNSIDTVRNLKDQAQRLNTASSKLSKDLIGNLENWTKTQADEMAKLVSQIKFTIDLVEQE